jgi:short-subunit dehydrogenase
LGLPAPSTAGAALVTGASSGIGAAIAAELASRGHALILVARREQRLQSLATELAQRHGVDAAPIAADLADPADRDALVARVNQSGRVAELLVNNAGFGSRGDFVSNDRERMVGMVRVNVEAVVDLTARFLPGMAERGRGAIINIASTAAFQPMPGAAAYAAGKAFVLSFSEALHTEQGGSGVGVTAVCPGPVRTEFTEVAGMTGVQDSTPDAIWMSADEVGRAAVEGAEQGKRVVVPGTINRAQAILGQHSPRALALPLIQRVWSASSRGSSSEG